MPNNETFVYVALLILVIPMTIYGVWGIWAFLDTAWHHKKDTNKVEKVGLILFFTWLIITSIVYIIIYF